MQLKKALEIQAGVADREQEPNADMVTEYKSYHINQRNEGIDLNGIAGALMATQNMQMQTFITEPMVLVSKPIVEESYCIASNIINRQDKNGGNGCGFQENISYTLTTSDIHVVCTTSKTYQNIVGALCVGDEKGIGNQYASQDKCIVDYQNMISEHLKEDREEHNTLRKEAEDFGSRIEKNTSIINIVRRLTPLECERLQGFPDGWTDIPKATDSPRYKALGNSVAIPCVDFILRGIAYFLRKLKQEEEER